MSMRDMHNPAYYEGTFSAGSYHVTQLLGTGPLSHTYLAEHPEHPGQKFVLKILEAAPLSTQQDQEQVLQEIRLHNYLQSPHLLPVMEVWLQEDVLYQVTTYAEAGSLRQRIANAPGSPLPLKEALT